MYLLRLFVPLSIFLVTCEGRPSYYILAPSYIIPGENTTLAVHWFGDKYNDITVSAGIMTTTSILVNVSRDFKHDVIGTISIPAIPSDPSTTSYVLAVIGCGEKLEFSRRIPVKMRTKNTSIFIQTDKAAYKPGEHVRIRVISVNHNLRPHKEDVDLIIKDPKNKIVKQWLKIKPDMGIVSKEFLLSDRLLLGDWKIQAASDGCEQSTNFSIAEYASPKFDVILDIQTLYIESKMLNLTGKIKAKHASDTPIKGNVTISVKPLYTVQGLNEVNKTYEISGTMNFSISQAELLHVLNREGLNVEYQNVSESFNSDIVYTRNPFIDIQTPNSPLKVGEEFDIRVTTYLKIMEIYYVVVSKGLVVLTGRNSTNFSLIPEASWVPSAELMVYWFNSSNNDDDIMQISKTLSIKGSLNKVSLSWNKNNAHPLEHVLLSVNVKEPQSLVGLRVVEKSSLLLQDGSDLTSNKVYDELMSYYQSPSASITDAVIQKKYDNVSSSGEPIMLPARHRAVLLPEIWMWKDTNMSSSLTKTIDVVVPDSSTSLVATAFVISEGLGLGIAEEAVEISVSKPFLMTLNMPNSVVRGEEFILEVILSSSLSENLQVLVSLERHDSYEIIVPRSINTDTVANQHSVTVSSQGGARILFPIRPKKLGNIPVTVKASSNVASSVLTKTVLVKAEGVKYFYSQTALFELNGNTNTSKTISRNISFTFPKDVVPGSEEAFITVIGDFLAPSINGLESLIEMPHGCGEQNMINFAPNIYILQYLIATNKINSEIREKAIHLMEQGYLKELTYRRYDGSFSAFGNSDSSGSTWLSAFVFRCFLQARTFIYINPDVLHETVEWLVQYQDLNTGIFSEPGRVIHTELQGGQNGSITLTAYILASLLEDDYYRNLYAPRVEKALQYLEKKFDEGIASNYALSLVAYALSLANSSKAHDALTLLNSRGSTTEGKTFWCSQSETSNYYWQPRTTDIETAAYALLSHFQQGRVLDGIPVMKWLSQQRNHLGGYLSTQDTIMALQALSKFLLLAPSYETSLTLAVTGEDSHEARTFHINSENHLVLQSQQMQVSKPLLVNAIAAGRGLAILQLNLMYNRKSSSRRRQNTLPEAFRLDVTVKEEENCIDRFSVNICMRFQGKGNESGMALLDVGYLSGFTMMPEGIISIQYLKLVEPKEGKVYLYFDSVTKEELCFSIPMVRYAKVAHTQNAVVRISDYYNPDMSTIRTYNSMTMQRISTCEYCGFHCNECISNIVASTQSSKSNVPTSSLFWFCIIVICYFV
ncbi:CD109 antigen-like [Engystomops pustulosus]|uniref:CD109 antigen-like n=1 Tax=Engystomops pustulosus TaxID=76066 RepID=UPI003AFA40A0